MNNLSSKFVVFKICSKVLFKIIYGSYFAFFSWNRKINLNLGFKIENFYDGNLFNIDLDFFFSYFPIKKYFIKFWYILININ